MCYTLYKHMQHLLFGPGEHGWYLCSSFWWTCTLIFFFPANHFPDSCCPNPVSPTFLSSMSASSLHCVYALQLYFSVYLPP